jgi:hypothetical protein
MFRSAAYFSSCSCKALQAADVGLAGLAHRLVGAAAFEQRHHRQQLVGIVLRYLGDLAALPRHRHHQAFGRQHLHACAAACG